MVVHARAHHAGSQRDIFHRFQFGKYLLHKLVHRFAIDTAAIHNSAAAPMRRLFYEQNPGTAFCRRARRLQASNSTSDDQQIAEMVEMFVGIRIRLFRRLAQTRRLADERFIDVLPERARVDEHLIVKACGQKPREFAVDRTDIKIETWPVVLARSLQSIKQLGGRDPLIGFELAAPPHVDQTVGFFRPRGHHASRAVILEGSPDQRLVVGEQCRGQRIPFETFKTAPIKGETERFSPVQQATAGGKTCAHLKALQDQPGLFRLISAQRSSGGSNVCAGYVPKTSRVMVQRAA